jgi:methyl-accepting chemotaxis protein
MRLRGALCWSGLLVGLVSVSSAALAQPAGRGGRGVIGDTEELGAQDREILDWINAFGNEISQVMERWVAGRETTEEKLFSRLYYPIPKTDPAKYTTDYDTLADRDFVAIQEKFLVKSAVLLYAVAADANGYVPTHNQKYAMPPTGNRAVDLLNSRTKRLFGERVGINASRSEAPYLLQQYKRDTGEVVYDLSVPVRVRNHHWGCVRIGYRRVEK